jgi:DNA topoisomerase-1
VVNTKHKFSHRSLLKAERDARHAASVASLTYINSDCEGITRVSKGKKFVYFNGRKQVRDKFQLERIRKLAIPPSWKDVWISKSPNGHIQATGTDLRGRKQYRYHAKWNALRNETKFHKLYEFGKTLPKLRKKIRRDMKSKDLSREKVLATAIDLMDKTYIRIGNNGYEKMNGSYGLTTLKDRHVKFQNGTLAFSFTGKKGIDHAIRLKDRKLAAIIKQCRDIPGKTLFQYYDSEGKQRPIDSGMVNSYIKEATSMEFSAKDFRTWAGSLQAVEYFRENPDLEEREDKKKVVKEMIESVSDKLGNTATVCKKYYIHPQLVALCEEGKMTADLLKDDKKSGSDFTQSENILMCILKKSI